jgi:23S rRNA pseudouridine1911/1915/1917 synthase
VNKLRINLLEKEFICDIDKIRLDNFLTAKFQISRSQVTELIKKGLVSIEGKVTVKTGTKLELGQLIYIKIQKQEKSQTMNVDFEVPIIFEDEDILVINKPPFLTVHPAPSVKELTLVDWLRAKNISLSTISGDERHGIVHRIDKETSGALVIAKNNASHTFLAKQLENRTLGRYYLALIDYPLKDDVMIVDKPIARNPKNRLKMGIIENGRTAKSAFCKLLTNEEEGIELIGAKLYSGRTHQIRVHLNAIGRHILGDILYGFKSQKVKISRVMLHAYYLYLIHPKSGQKMSFAAPLYCDFEEQLQKFFTKETINEAVIIDNLYRRFNFIS